MRRWWKGAWYDHDSSGSNVIFLLVSVTVGSYIGAELAGGSLDVPAPILWALIGLASGEVLKGVLRIIARHRTGLSRTERLNDAYRERIGGIIPRPTYCAACGKRFPADRLLFTGDYCSPACAQVREN